MFKRNFAALPLQYKMKAGFINIIGKPNAGKSSLLNALLGEKLAIVSSKVQTTRHRIRAFLNGPDYQIVFSDTPGVIKPQYKLHERMMQAVRSSMEDADLCLLVADIRDDFTELDELFSGLSLKIPSILVFNKVDLTDANRISEARNFFQSKSYGSCIVAISATKNMGLDVLLKRMIELLPEGQPFFDPEEITDMPTKFFVAELIREKIYDLFEDEIPYQTTVTVSEFKEKPHLIRISAEIVVHRESQKAILLGKGGERIKLLGQKSREAIEKFLDSKVYLELFVKVRANWRNNDLYLKEYGYS